MIEYVNKEYLETHKNITIKVEMDEMWSFYSQWGLIPSRSAAGRFITIKSIKSGCGGY
jgi:hypothetical protein